MRKKLVAGILVAVVGVVGLAVALLAGVVYIGLEAPFLYIPASNEIYMLRQPALFAVAYVYPNGSYILEAWVYNPNAYPIETGYLGVTEVAPNPNAFWGPTGEFGSGLVEPYSFAFNDRWSGLTINESEYMPRYLQPPQSGVLWYNGSGEFRIGLGYGSTSPYSTAAPAIASNFEFIGNGPNGTHVWVAVPEIVYMNGTFALMPVYKCEIPPNFPYPQYVKVINGSCPPWWGIPGI